MVVIAAPNGRALAASGNLLVDVSPETSLAAVGTLVTLTILAVDDLGAANSGVNIRVYFASGPNDPGARRSTRR